MRSPLWYWSGSGTGSRCRPLYQGSDSEAAGANGKVLGKVLHVLRAVPRMTSSRPLGTLASVVYGRLWTAYLYIGLGLELGLRLGLGLGLGLGWGWGWG